MPKFELNPRTGMMEPKKDEQIYFAGSMGGGLRIDDHKNNVKYIIERDGRITNLFGIRGENLNIYDMRDARIIADRVARMFGRSHKYSDFHYFLKGYRMSEDVVKDFDEFLSEGLWSDIVSRGASGETRKENGKLIGIVDDIEFTMPFEAFDEGEIVTFDNDKNYYHLEETDDYFAIITNSGLDNYYRYDPDLEAKNMVPCFHAEEKLRKNDFGFLKALLRGVDGWSELSDLDGMDVDVNNTFIRFSNDEEYMVFESDVAAENYAIDTEKDFLDDRYLYDEKYVNTLRSYYGDDFFDMKSIEDTFRESEDSYYDDIDDYVEELLSRGIIKDTEEYFELDEDGEPDHDMPKFDKEDYRYDFIDYMIKNIDDLVDEFISNFGYDGIYDFIDIDKLAERVVNIDGKGNIIASYDGEEGEETIDGVTYLIYRIN